MRSCYLVRKPRGMAALWGFNRKQMMLSLPLGCPRFLPREDRERGVQVRGAECSVALTLEGLH